VRHTGSELLVVCEESVRATALSEVDFVNSLFFHVDPVDDLGVIIGNASNLGGLGDGEALLMH
jgi:hypothetical protein